ncbi:MAG: hypothetical protein HRT74_06875, partial [Flavobacteriales bacterium]|nr:hypothetical protein [Flavobacteriales bacterium]
MSALNHKYPVFFDLEKIEAHISGGGEIALEKLHFLWKNSPDADVSVWSETYLEEITHRDSKYKNTTLKGEKIKWENV